MFVNIEDKDQIDVIDVAAKKVSASWPVSPGTSPTGMSLDRASHRLFVGAGKVMLMMDAASGKVVASVPICSGTDATWYDAGTKLAFSSCRDGHITVARVDGDKMTVVQTIDTAPGSKTMGIDTTTHKLYVAAAKPNTHRRTRKRSRVVPRSRLWTAVRQHDGSGCGASDGRARGRSAAWRLSVRVLHPGGADGTDAAHQRR